MSDPDDGDAGGSTLDSPVDAPRGDATREWELFVRESAADPLRHAGSVSAPTAETARERAAKLFGWTAETLWLCPADETRRFAADGASLAGRTAESECETEPAGGDAGGERA
ncbi:MAG: Htur_1727 family rSAM-partnered candidate RiPP [Halosimplex sp.]